MNWKNELKALKLAYLKKHSPGFYELSGGERMKILPYSDQSTNKLTTAVYDWLKYSGHYVNRINSTGVARRINGVLQYTNSSTNKGTADLDAIIHGKPVKIEIKCAATKDKASKHQLKEQARIEAAGGIYIVVTDMPSFVDWYKQFTAKATVYQGANDSA